MHDVHHLLSDLPDLTASSVGCLLDLILPSLGKSNAEEAQEVIISRLDDYIGLDEGLPFADEGAQLVGSEVESVEVG